MQQYVVKNSTTMFRWIFESHKKDKYQLGTQTQHFNAKSSPFLQASKKKKRKENPNRMFWFTHLYMLKADSVALLTFMHECV